MAVHSTSRKVYAAAPAYSTLSCAELAEGGEREWVDSISVGIYLDDEHSHG